MSLLIKALEQAAKDRDNAKAGGVGPSTQVPAAGSAEPTLEPPPPPRVSPSLEPSPSPDPPRATSAPSLEPAAPPRATSAPSLEPAAPPRAPPGTISSRPAPGDPTAARANPTLTLDPTAASRLAAKSSASMANIDAQHQRARAATVMQASRGAAPAAWAYVRGNPVILFGGLAALFGIAFGVYVYLQIAQPGLFVRQASTPAPQTSAPPPLPATPPEPAQAALASAPIDSGSLTNPAVALPGAPSAPAPVPGNPYAPPTTGALAPSSTVGPVSSAALIGRPGPAEPPRDPQPTRVPEPRREPAAAAPAPEAPAPARAAPPVSAPAFSRPATPAAAAGDSAARGRDPIMVTPAAQQPRLNPALSQAYTALQTGDLDEARSLYSRVAQSEPLNIDALLGMAYIAAQDNRTDDAVKLYVRILQLNPRHAAAQAALIGVMGRADPVSAETRVKQLISREPSPFLHFILGNIYADQGLWAQAQQAYFQAHHLEPGNPDYAYNLAVGLDHLRQGKVALGFYRRAEQLAGAQGRANFNLSHARDRISALSSQLE